MEEKQQYVTVIRKTGGCFVHEDITTTTTLPGSGIDAVQNRTNIIARLRKDPSVVLVLDAQDRKCEEHTALADGFEMTVTLGEGENASASLLVEYEGSCVCRKEYLQEDAEDERSFRNAFFGEILWILSCVDRKDYCFVDEDCPYFEEVEAENPLTLYDVERILRAEGFQCERIKTLDWMSEPCLFICENEIVLVGSYHFAGALLFVEMKRIFVDREAKTVNDAVAKFQSNYDIEVIPWHDGTWSFRKTLDNEMDEDAFLKQLLSVVAELKEFIKKVELQGGLYESTGFETDQIRQFFIYETIDTSLKVSRLPI